MYAEYQGESSTHTNVEIRVNKWIHLQSLNLSVNSITDDATDLPTSTNPASPTVSAPLPNFSAPCFAFHTGVLPNWFQQEPTRWRTQIFSQLQKGKELISILAILSTIRAFHRRNMPNYYWNGGGLLEIVLRWLLTDHICPIFDALL